LSPSPPPLDPVYLADIFEAGGEALLRDIVGTFLDDAPRRLRTLHAHLDTGDWNGAALSAHTLVSGSSMLGLTGVATAARRVELILAEHRRPPAPELEALDGAVAAAGTLLAAAVDGLVAGQGTAR
jgi:HPt (histidine-containing phosphotransfer) domain-containing protein